MQINKLLTNSSVNSYLFAKNLHLFISHDLDKHPCSSIVTIGVDIVIDSGDSVSGVCIFSFFWIVLPIHLISLECNLFLPRERGRERESLRVGFGRTGRRKRGSDKVKKMADNKDKRRGGQLAPVTCVMSVC